MKSIYIFLITISIIIAVIFLTTFGFFSYILYRKYSYLFKIVRKMENEKYLWPLNKKISIGITNHIRKDGTTLLIGVGNCGVLDVLIKKMDPTAKIDVIDSNKYLLDIAQEKYGERCNYINENFIYKKMDDKQYDNIVSSLPHKEFSLKEIDTIFSKYFILGKENIVYLENKVPHVKHSYVKMLLDGKMKEGWELVVKKNYKNFPPVNICALHKGV